MAEPVSAITIVTTVLKAVNTSITTAQTISDYVSKYKMADVQIATMITECVTIRQALLEVQNIVLKSNMFQRSETEGENAVLTYVRDDYRGILGQCMAVFALLNERLQKLNLQRLNQRNKSSAKAKIKAVWFGDSMKTLRENIRGQVAAISLLLHALQAGVNVENAASNKRNFEKVFEYLTEIKSATLLKQISDDARSLSISAVARKAVENDEDAQSILEKPELVFEGPLAQSSAEQKMIPVSKRQLNPKAGISIQAASRHENLEDDNSTAFPDSDRFSFVTARSKYLPSIRTMIRPRSAPSKRAEDQATIEMLLQTCTQQVAAQEDESKAEDMSETLSMKKVQDVQQARWEYLLQLSSNQRADNWTIDQYEETEKEFQERASSLMAQIAGKRSGQ